MPYPSRAAAVFFTTTSALATAETTLTALYMPYRWLPVLLASFAALLALLAGDEWTALRAHQQRPASARHDTYRIATRLTTGHDGARHPGRS
ncbi:hypothetical protein [Streptomyces griseosporeus]|uniref:hypothetical protein n=1 Tax=Streptomyces griseosporeus TaxID=1910 RepID=UPI00378E74A8